MHRRLIHHQLAVIATLGLLASCSSGSDPSAGEASGTSVADATTGAPPTTLSVATTTISAPADGSTTTTAQLAPAVATPTDCPADAPSNRTCYTVAVPVEPADPTGPTLNLAVTARRADPTTWHSPVLALLGEVPGYAWASHPPDFAADHDMVWVDNRGAGRSDGVTHCPELSSFAGEINALRPGAGAAAAIGGCLDRARGAGVSLASIADHDIAAADLVVVRRALGIDTWGVYAAGPGTDIALHLSLADGAAISGIAARNPYAAGSRAMLADMAASFDHYAADCAAAPTCGTNGDLQSLLDRAVAATESDVVTNTKDPSGDPVVLGRDSFLNGVRAAMADPDLAKVLPAILAGAASGAGQDTAAGAFIAFPLNTDASALLGFCQQQDYTAPGLARSPEPDAGAFATLSNQKLCAAFGDIPQFAPRPTVSSTVPVLAMFMDYGSVGRATVEAAFDGFSRTNLVEVPGIANPVRELPECFESTINTFFDAPTSTLDTSCLTSPAVKTLG